MGYNDVTIIEASDGFKRVIDVLTDLAQNGRNVFRGYNKQDELLPSLIREKTSYTNVEIELLKEFERYGSHYFHASTPIDFMSYAQHFGLPTRLLDFTFNPFIALSFALHSPKSNGEYKEPSDKLYYYIRYASLDENLCAPSIPLNDEIYNTHLTRTDSLAVKASQCIDSMTDLFGKNNLHRNIWALDGFKDSLKSATSKQERIKSRAILFIDPNQSNQRIIMQQGLFMFPYTLEKNDHLDIINRNSSVIMIHKDLRTELLRYLDTIGFSTFRLMPDLASVCYAVKRKVIDERQSESSLFKKTPRFLSKGLNIEELHALLKTAFEKYRREDGYANIAPVGAFVKRSIPDFDIHTYGFSKLSDLIAYFPDKYEIKKDSDNRAVPIALFKCK